MTITSKKYMPGTPLPLDGRGLAHAIRARMSRMFRAPLSTPLSTPLNTPLSTPLSAPIPRDSAAPAAAPAGLANAPLAAHEVHFASEAQARAYVQAMSERGIHAVAEQDSYDYSWSVTVGPTP